MLSTRNYFRRLMPDFRTKPTTEILPFSDSIGNVHKEAEEVKVDVYDYNAEKMSHFQFNNVHNCHKFKNNGHITWINIDGLRKADVETICNEFGIHPLLIED